MEPVKWRDFYGDEHFLMEGRGDDVFHVMPNRKDEDGNCFTEILSKKAIVEFAKQYERQGEHDE